MRNETAIENTGNYRVLIRNLRKSPKLARESESLSKHAAEIKKIRNARVRAERNKDTTSCLTPCGVEAPSC